MMEQKLSQMDRYFEEQIAICHRRGQALLADGRADEAAFEKVRANVFGIFRTVLSVAAKSGGGDPDAVRRFFAQKAGQIPASWAAAYGKAKQHNDTARMHLEQIKLGTAAEIRENFAKIWEGAQ